MDDATVALLPTNEVKDLELKIMEYLKQSKEYIF